MPRICLVPQTRGWITNIQLPSKRSQEHRVSHTYVTYVPTFIRVYLLVRISGTKTLQDRVENDVFASKIFDTLRSQFSTPQEFHEKIVQKIVPVQGDITVDRLGLSEADQRMIHEDTRVVINSAASVSFDDPLNNALEVSLLPYHTVGGLLGESFRKGNG